MTHRLIVIGTLHAGLTPEHELLEVLEQYAPNHLMVEMTDADVKAGTATSYPPEMIAAYRWARPRGINVRGFDVAVDGLKAGLTDQDNQRAIEEEKVVLHLRGLTWKDLNKAGHLKLFTTTNQWLIDPVKNKERTQQMLATLSEVMPTVGTVVIVIGCSHLSEVRKKFPQAEFPFAD